MHKYITISAIAILLFAATIGSEAQNTTTATPPTTCKFNDIVEVNLDGICTYGDRTTVGLKNIFAYRVADFASVGFGIGLQSESYSVSIPLSADFRYYFHPQKVAAPFLNLYTGYSLNGATNFAGGNDIFLGSNFGININITQQIGLQLAVGLKLDHYGGFLLGERPGATSNFLSVPFTLGVTF